MTAEQFVSFLCGMLAAYPDRKEVLNPAQQNRLISELKKVIINGLPVSFYHEEPA